MKSLLEAKESLVSPITLSILLVFGPFPACVLDPWRRIFLVLLVEVSRPSLWAPVPNFPVAGMFRSSSLGASFPTSQWRECCKGRDQSDARHTYSWSVKSSGTIAGC